MTSACVYREKKGDDVITSQEFHDIYYEQMYDRQVIVRLKDGRELRGLFNDEFFEDNSVLVDCQVVPIDRIESMKLLEEK